MSLFDRDSVGRQEMWVKKGRRSQSGDSLIRTSVPVWYTASLLHLAPELRPTLVFYRRASNSLALGTKLLNTDIYIYTYTH